MAAFRMLAVAAALCAAMAVPAGAQDAPREPDSDQWIVQLDAAPAAQLQPGSAAAGARSAEIDRQADRALQAAAPSVKADVRYRTAFSGFAARLTDEQATAMRSAPGVRRVTRERFYRPTAAAPTAPDIGGSEADHLGLPAGLWKRLGGAAKAGRGTIVGVVDTGITPEAPSFADRGLAPPESWDGACQGGEAFPTTSCSDKLIGARYFVDGVGTEFLPPEAYLSPRDDSAHGTHVAAIAAGNLGVDPSIAANPLGVARLTGIAPAAHLAAYKACWPFEAFFVVCSDVDVIAAIDRAVADGVDVLNLSLGGGADGVTPLDVAVLNADAAGVFVAAAAGNDGERPGALGSPAAMPWTAAVGATTGARTFTTTIEARGPDGASASATGTGVAGAQADVPFVDARSFETGEEEPFDRPRHCMDGMTRERVAGKVVICEPSPFFPPDLMDRALAEAGAAGIVFLMPQTGAENRTTTTRVPSLHMREDDAAPLRRIAAAAGATVSSQAATASDWQTDRVAWFSSRGPSETTGDLLRPDVSAPGVGVLSAYAPDTFFAAIGREPRERFGARSGTSAATPQVAGAGALLTQVHPTWSPAAIRSALVTTAAPAVDSGGSGPAPHVAAGQGRIDPTAAADAGLVVEPSTDEYRRFAEGIDPGAIEGDLDPIAARDLNMPSVSLDRAIEPMELRRTVTSVGSRRTTWSAAFEGGGLGRFDVLVTPSQFTIAPGQRRTITIQLATDVGSRAFRDGRIRLTAADGRSLLLPVSARNPGIVDPPERIAIQDAPETGARELRPRIAARVSGVAHGLVAPEVHADRVTRTIPSLGVEEDLLPVTVGEDVVMLGAQLALRGAEPEFFSHWIVRDVDEDGRLSPSDDVLTGGFPRATSSEIMDPEPGRYLIWFQSPELPGGEHVRFDVRTWLVRDAEPDDPDPAPGLVLDGDPQRAYPAAERPFQLRWSGVGGSERLLGLVTWQDGDRQLARSIVEVDPPGAPRSEGAGAGGVPPEEGQPNGGAHP